MPTIHQINRLRERDPTVLIPLRGRLRTTDGDGSRILNRGQVLVAEAGQRLQAIGGRSSLWLAFIAPNAAWQQLFDAAGEMPIPEPILFPAVHASSRLVRRTAARAAREARRAESSTHDSVTLLQFASLLADLQSEFDPMIRRCRPSASASGSRPTSTFPASRPRTR